MDFIVGKEKKEYNSNIRQSKDESSSQVCPMYGCNSSSVKIARHLNTIHSDLNEDAATYAAKM